MKVFILTQETREQNSYNVEILGVFREQAYALSAMQKEVQQAEDDGFVIRLQGVSAVQMIKQPTVINYTISGKEVE